MDREQFRKAGYAAIDRVCDYFETLESQELISSVKPGEVGKLLAAAAPVQGEEWSAISADFDRVILPGITHWQHPSFMAFFPSNTTYESILADIYAGAVSNPGFNWACSPACTELEVVMMDWVAQLLGLSPSFHNASEVGGGIIMGSASEACLTICVAARARVQRMLPNVRMEDLVMYGSTQTHSIGAKAALILGLEFVAVETREEDDWALRGEALRAALEEGKARGKVPFMLVATIGTTSTGAIDNIAEITAVAADYPELFVHVDAAWAGVFLSCPELREECQVDAINARSKTVNSAAGICASGEVHSFSTNLHKAGLVTFDACCLWVRDRKLLTEALDVTPVYLRNKQSDSGTVVDYRNWQLPLGRRFRSLKLFFVLRSFGVAGFQAHLRKQITLATHLEQLVRAHPATFELFTPRRFSLVVFRLRLPFQASTEEATDKLNRDFFARISDRHDVYLTATVVGGKYCTRVCIGSALTQVEHVEKTWEIIQGVAEEARRALGPKN